MTYRPAVFLDRDGVLNEIVRRDGRVESPRLLHELRVAADAPGAVSRFRRAGLPVLVVTNQPDLARGLLSRSGFEAMMGVLREQVGFDDSAVCPHEDRDECGCRKPRPGMLETLAERWDVDPSHSWMVGDTWRDVEAGRAAGCRTVLLRTWYNQDVDGDVVVESLGAAADRILQEHGLRSGGQGP
jgi:D-glycero-D-manno-heptose 1,7-bisphosphate phosphatase